MHDRETDTGPVAVPALEVEKEMEFDWDQGLRVSARTREALEFMSVTLERYHTVGQPLWPVVPSSLYGAFLAREETNARVLVNTFDASVHGWGRAGSGGSRRLPPCGGPARRGVHRAVGRSRTVRRRRCTGTRLPASWQPLNAGGESTVPVG